MGSPNPLVSVILPFFNAKFLKQSVESILQQTYTNFELILVDNGSTDSSVDVAKSYLNHHNVTLVKEPKRGVVFAANKGIDLANGDLIARMDSDDIADLNRLSNQIQLFKKNPSLNVVSGQVEYLGPKENEGFIQYVEWLNSIQTAEEISLNQFVEFPIANPTMMFKQRVFLNHGGYADGDFPEDYELFLRLQAANVKMGKVDQVVLKWRDSETRLTRTDSRYDQDAFFQIKAEYLAKWLQINNQHHPHVYIWGAGRLSRRRSEYLLGKGVELVKYIDLKESNQVIHYKSIPKPSEAFVVSYVANRGAREEIRTFLNRRGYQEGLNYVIAS